MSVQNIIIWIETLKMHINKLRNDIAYLYNMLGTLHVYHSDLYEPSYGSLANKIYKHFDLSLVSIFLPIFKLQLSVSNLASKILC